MDLTKQVILKFDLSKVWFGFLLVCLSVVFLIVSVWIVSTQDYADTDFFSFWLAGYSIRVGQDPYSAEWWTLAHDRYGADWISDATFLYPIPLAIFFIPLGFFSLEQAFVLWVYLSQWMILLATVLLLRRRNWKVHKKYLLPVLAGIFLFRPVILTWFHGQLGAFFLLILVFMLLLWENHKWFLGGLLLPLLVLKPSFGLLICAMLGMWLIVQKKWTALTGALTASLSLCLLGWLYNPTWISEFLMIGSGKLWQTFGYSPTVWGVSGQLCSQSTKCTLIFGGFLAGILLLAFFYFLLQSPENLSPPLGFSLIIPIALLITPYGWAYDQILLIIPVLIVIMVMIAREFPYIVPSTLFLLISLVALVFVLVAMQIEYDMWSAGMTLVCLSLVVGMLGGTKRLTSMR